MTPAERMRLYRQKQSKDERQSRLDKNAAAGRARREGESLEDNLLTLDQDRCAHAKKRENETPEEGQSRLDKVSCAVAAKRENETPEERRLRLEKDADAHSTKRRTASVFEAHENQLATSARGFGDNFYIDENPIRFIELYHEDTNCAVIGIGRNQAFFEEWSKLTMDWLSRGFLEMRMEKVKTSISKLSLNFEFNFTLFI